MTDGAFPRDRHLTAIAIAYKNPEIAYIADAVFPRIEVGKKTFHWWEYPTEEAYQAHDTKVGETSTVNRVQLKGTRRESTCEDFGIDIPLTADDIKQAPPGVDPRERAVEQATDIVMRDREIEAAALAFAAANYPTSQKSDLNTADTQWDDPDADPIRFIRTKLDLCLVRPNIMAFGQAAWNGISMHPKVVAAANGNEGTSGVAARQRLAELLELTEIVVGTSQINTVKPGLAPSLAKVWGKAALAFFRDRNVGTSGGITFGYTATEGTRVAGSKEVDMGLRGGVLVRSGETRKVVIAAPYAAHLFYNAVG